MRPAPATVALVLTALLLAAPGRAEEEASPVRYVHDRWTQRDGLPHNVVEAVLASRSGDLWLGTQEGLVRFDGARFRVFDRATTPGLAGDQVYALLEDPDGTLWIGTSTGLSRLRGQTFELVDTGGSGHENVHSLARDGDDLFAGTTSGLLRLHGGAWSRLGASDGLPDERISALAKARGGGLWVGGRRGAARWSGGRVERVDGRGLPSETVTAVLEDADGALWVGTSRGLARRAPGAAAFSPVTAAGEQEVYDLATTRELGVWAALATGLVRVTGDAVERPAPGHFRVNKLHEDAEGSVWFGTATDGLHRLRRGTVVTLSSENGLSSRVAWAVALGGDGEVLVSGDGGLDRIAGGRPVPVPLGLARGEGLSALLRDRAGNLWVGTDAHGVLRRGPGGDHWFRPTEGLRTLARVIYQDRAGTIWMGARDGLYRVEGGRIALAAQTKGQVSALQEDPDGRLWLGTTLGLARLEASGLVEVPLPGPQGPTDVTAFHLDPDGSLWVGTVGAGLWLLRGERRHAFTRRQGLLENQVFSILDDGLGYLWLSGNHGLSRVARAELEAVAGGRATAVAATTLGRSDGMREIECSGGVQPSGLRTPDGRLWFPTIDGVVVVAPESVRPNPVPLRARMEEVVVDGRTRPPPDELRLPPDTQHVEIRYGAPALTSADRVRFRHRLRGLEERFVDAGAERVVHYAGLPPGQYLFELSAANESGLWSTTPATLAFEILPRFWQTVWFQALTTLAAAGLALLAFGWRLRQLQAQKRALAARVDEEAAKVKALSGLLPVCSWCKRIRDRHGSWQQLERYISTSEKAEITHVMCPECFGRTEEPGDG